MNCSNVPAGELNRFLYTDKYGELCSEAGITLGKSVIAITHQNQMAIEVDNGKVYYTFRAWVEYENQKTDDLRLTCILHFDGTSCSLSIVDVLNMEKERYVKPKRYGIYTDQHLIPKLKTDEQREQEAQRFLLQYCPKTLRTPMPVPIRTIMEEQMKLLIDANVGLISNASGQTMFDSGEMLVMAENGKDIELRQYSRETVFIDGIKALEQGLGSMNFTLAHEAYHWFAHRPFKDLHRIIGKQSEESYNGVSKYSTSDIIEIQANAIAGRILMPREMFLQKYRELAGNDIYKTIAGLSAFFRVSYSSAAIRLSQLGIAIPHNDTIVNRVTWTETTVLYFGDEKFRRLVDEELIVFVGDGYVYNDPKYIKESWEEVPKVEQNGTPYTLTDFALANPHEAYVSFRIAHERIAGGDNVLMHESDEILRASVDTIRKRFPSISAQVGRHASRFEAWYQKESGKHKSYCELAKDFIDYRYGRMDLFNPGSMEGMEWDPETELPDIHEDYFQPDRLNQLKAQLEEVDNGDEYDEEKAERLMSAIEREEELEDDISDRFQSNFVARELDNKGHISEDATSPRYLFCADTLQPRTYYNKIMKGEAGRPEPRMLMSLCVGMCLRRKASAALFQSAGRTLTWSREDMAYRYILSHLRGRSIEDVDLFLDDLGLPLLGSYKNTNTKGYAKLNN